MHEVSALDALDLSMAHIMPAASYGIVDHITRAPITFVGSKLALLPPDTGITTTTLNSLLRYSIWRFHNKRLMIIV